MVYHVLTLGYVGEEVARPLKDGPPTVRHCAALSPAKGGVGDEVREVVEGHHSFGTHGNRTAVTREVIIEKQRPVVGEICAVLEGHLFMRATNKKRRWTK